MKFQYVFRSHGSDIELAESDLCLPFKISPTKVHPFLTLRDYFDAIRSFLVERMSDRLKWTLGEALGSTISVGDMNRLLIRSEKHGAFNHVASIEFITNKGTAKFALATFLSSSERWFRSESANLERLQLVTSPYQFTPRLYLKGQYEITRNGQAETLFFLMSQWLEGFYEWHLHRDLKKNECDVVIWDHDRGRRLASREEVQEIFYKIGFILATCYDPEEYRRVGLWSNAAGDFVVGRRGSVTDILLTTVRDYSPVLDAQQVKPGQSLMPMTFFFLETLTLIRLDREEGIGDLLWCEDWCLDWAVKGIFDAFEEKARQAKLPAAMPSEFITVLKSFTPEEIKTLLQYTVTRLGNTNPELYKYVATRLGKYADELYNTIQRSPI